MRVCVCVRVACRCLEDEMNGKHERMKLVARQSQFLSSITELAVSLRRPPQDVVPALFLRLDVSCVSCRVPCSVVSAGACMYRDVFTFIISRLVVTFNIAIGR